MDRELLSIARMRFNPRRSCRSVLASAVLASSVLASSVLATSALASVVLGLAFPMVLGCSDGQVSGATDASLPAVDGAVAQIDAAMPAPWPPIELMRETDPQPTGDGWRTAQWNVCTTRLDGSRVECRARISPSDETRTAAQLERAAIAKIFVEDVNLYSFSFQEICEQDARWIAAFVANHGPPAAGWDREFSTAEYQRIDDLAPYAFVPYFTSEMLGTRDLGCGPSYSTGVAVVAKQLANVCEPKTLGFTNESYEQRAGAAFSAADLQDPEVCSYYFEAQTSYDPANANDPEGPRASVMDFRSQGCSSSVPDTVRGIACVRTRWQGPGDSTSYRVSTCATHAVHKGAVTAIVRNHHIDEAGRRVFAFAGGTDQRSILSGDFNVMPNRGATIDLDAGAKGHATILTSAAHGFGKVTIGNHDTSSATGTSRGTCGREIDAIYAKNAWWLLSATPNASVCRDYPEEDPVATGPTANPYEWSDHEMMVSPLMSPHGTGPSDL